MRRIVSNTLATVVSALPAVAAVAHDGHGAAGAHWHLTDAWGLVGVGVLIAVALFLRGRR